MSKTAFFASFMAALLHCLWGNVSLAGEHQLRGAVIGKKLFYQTRNDDSLPEIARSYDVGFNAMAFANPDVDPFLPGPQRYLVIPSEWILPQVPLRQGIVINRAEMRLYLFLPAKAQTVTSFPVGVGDLRQDTPLGVFTVIEKIKNPAWHVPPSIKRERPHLPAVVPPGPDNPLGSHALRLSARTLLIHGPNRPWGIGTRNTHGCIRLYEEDIVQLFGMVGTGERVTIIHQPVKAAKNGDAVYLEVHDYYEDGRDLYAAALKVLAEKKLASGVDLNKVWRASRERSGVPVDVSKAGRSQ